MKRYLAFMALAAELYACQSNVKSEDSEKKNEIEERIKAYVEAFNQHDATAVSKLWKEDAYYINLTTEESATGSAEVADYLKSQFEELNGPDKIKIELTSIYFPASDEAIAKGMADITDKNHTLEKSAFIAHFVKEDETWLIQDFSVNELNPPESHFEQLKSLDWLVGNWVDDDDNIDVTYSFEWDKNKNFLNQHFVMSILGNEVLSGNQVIGWDPNAKEIRSWIFDSDGGYGESTWEMVKDNTWYASLNFTLPQGGKATAVHQLEKVDEDTFVFASKNRDIDGKLLPNIGPFKVVRRK